MITITKIKGISECCPESIEGTSDWYYCKEGKDSLCDLYEAEEIVRDRNRFSGMNCHLLHYPDGTVHSPFELRENVYVEAPLWDEGLFYFLAVDFTKQEIQICSYEPEARSRRQLVRLPLSTVKDCYNLMLKPSPVMLCRDGNEGALELIWPERKTFQMEEREGFLFRDEESMYFSQWEEAPDYREYVIVRDYETGRIKKRFAGYLQRMAGGVYWQV